MRTVGDGAPDADAIRGAEGLIGIYDKTGDTATLAAFNAARAEGVAAGSCEGAYERGAYCDVDGDSATLSGYAPFAADCADRRPARVRPGNIQSRRPP